MCFWPVMLNQEQSLRQEAGAESIHQDYGKESIW